MADFLLEQRQWPHMPVPHRAFLEACIPLLRGDPRLLGLAAGGSFIRAAVDEYSDLDLVVVAKPEDAPGVLHDAQPLAATLGPLLASFIGEHVGERRLLICLYGPPLLHVDLKFVSTDDLAHRVEDPILLWDRDGSVRRAMSHGAARYPAPDLQWIEDRFWVWMHYIVTKIARQELFEVLDALAFLRARVLGPLILCEAGAQPNGVRRIEQHAPDRAAALCLTIGAHDTPACRAALAAVVDLYVDLRDRLAPPSLVRRSEAERAARAFMAR